MPQHIRYQVIGPLESGEGSRASLGLRIEPDGQAFPAVFVWVPEQVLLSEEKLHALQRETARAKQLVHPNITRVYGLAELEGKLARVVDFTDGETLRTVLKVVKRLPPAFAARVIADASMGVHYAHLAGNDDGSPLVHGDLRPETLMISLAGVSRVAGYGALSVAPKESNGKRVVGRRLYSAPEQVRGGRDAATPETDVFLLGVALYECLTGKRPFSRRPDVQEAVQSEPLPPVYLPSVPDGLNHVLQRATAKKPSDRYPTPLVFREELELALGDLPSSELLAAYLLNFYPDVVPPHQRRRHQLEVARVRVALSPTTSLTSVAEIGDLPLPPPAAIVSVRRPPPEPRSVPEEVVSVAAPPPPPAVARPRPVPVPVAVAVPDYDDEDEAPRPRAWGWMAAAAVIAFGVVLVAAQAFKDPVRPDPIPFADDGLHASPTTSPPPPSVSPPAPASPTASVTPAVAKLSADLKAVPAVGHALAPAQVKPVASVSSPSPVFAAGPGFSLRTDPVVEVLISGKSQGRTPLALPFTPGKYKLQLRDDAKAINTFRTLTITAAGPRGQEYKLGKGSISLKAPAGSTSVVDGRPMGEGSFSASLYEGYHHVVVHYRNDRWEDDFRVGADEKLDLEAYFDPPSEGSSAQGGSGPESSGG